MAQSVWTGAGASPYYNVAGNWAGGVLPANNGSATLDFAPSPPLNYIYISSPVSVAGIDFTAGYGFSDYYFYTTGSGALTIGAGGVTTHPGTNTSEVFDLPVILSASQTWDGSGGYLVDYSDISETSGSAKALTTAGTLYLYGNNTFSGGVNVTGAGNLYIENTGAGTGPVVLSDGSTLESFYDTATVPGAVTFAGNASLGAIGFSLYGDVLNLDGPIAFSSATPTLTFRDGVTLLNGAITAGAGTVLTVTGFESAGAQATGDGGAQVVLSGPTSGLAGLTLDNMQVILRPTTNATTAFSSILAGGITLQDGAYLGLDGNYTSAGAVGNFFTTYAPSLSSTTLNGSIGFDTYGGGTTNVFADPINISGIVSGNFLGLGSATTAILSSSAVITPAGNYYFGGGGGTLMVQSLLTDGGSARGLVMTNAPAQLTLLVQGGANYSGGTTSDGGILIFDSNAPTAGEIQNDSGDTGYVGYTEMAGNITNAGQFIGLFSSGYTGVIGFDSTVPSNPRTVMDAIDLTPFTAGDPFLGTATVVTLSGAITPVHGHYQFTGVKGGALTVSSSLGGGSNSVVIGLVNPVEANQSTSSVTLSGDNSYGGGTVLNSGALYVTVPNALGTEPLSVPNTVSLNNAPVLAASGSDVVLSNAITVAEFGGSNSPGLLIGNPNTSDLLTLGGTIGDGSSPAIVGIQGHVALTGTNTYTGGTVFNSSSSNSVAYVSNSSAFGTSSVTVETESAIIPMGAGVTLSNPINLQSELTLGAPDNPNTLTLTGAISGYSDLNILSNVELDGTNTFNGGVTVTNSLLTIGSAEALGSGSLSLYNSGLAYTIPNPVIENFNGDAESTLSLTSGQVLTLDNQTGYINEYSGLIQGDVSNSVVKTGPGAEILDGANTYGGGTTVNGGTLVANASMALGSGSVSVANGGTLAVGLGVSFANPITLASGAALGGNGTFAPVGGVTIAGGAIVNPFNAYSEQDVATLSFGTGLTFGPSGVYDFGVKTAAGAAGVDYSTISVSGAFTVTATPGSPFVLNVSSLDPGTFISGQANFNAMLPYTWTILSAGSISGFSALDFTIETGAFLNPLNGGSFNLAEVGNTLTLNFTPVPEPSTWALLAAGACLLAVVARRRATA